MRVRPFTIPSRVDFTMSDGDTRAEVHEVLFGLPRTAPAVVLRVGRLLVDAGHPDAAAEIYEHFIRGLEQHELSPIETGGNGAGGHLSLPVRTHPERYSLA
jgi:hypothetical protein